MTNTTGPSKAAIVNAWRVIMREAARVKAETQKEQAA
jgi:hypothetical protein